MKKAFSWVMFALLLMGMLTSFNIHPAKAFETIREIHINADGSIDPPDAPISTVDNITYTFTEDITYTHYNTAIWIDRDHIVLDGNGYTLQGPGGWAGGHGIDLYHRSNVTIRNVEVKAFTNGIYLFLSSNNHIAGNNITNNDNGNGIYIEWSSNNTISGNDITNNIYSGGISLWHSIGNSIIGNNITNNKIGIWLSDSSNNNSMVRNDITNNNDGGIGLYESSGNKFYHNNVMNNTDQVRVPSYTSMNAWDDGYPSGGNYWSDYTGTDANGDGIGDTPYVIDMNNQDRYPLMSSYTPPEHELVTSLTALASLQLGSSSSLSAMVTNEGLNAEANVELMLLVNGTTVNSTTIPLLQAGSSYTLSYLWTPTVKGKYNVTAYANPVPGETSVEDNRLTGFSTVSVPPQVGVKAGDWIKCTYTISGWPTGTPYPEWLKVEFLSVEGTSATVLVTMHMSDGTEQNATVPVDVVAGGQAFGLSGFVIPANLTTGDVVYMSGFGNVTIAGETTGSYAGASRTVVHASFSQYGTQLTYYWDKQTGVIVEASTTSGTMTGTGKATETNMWQPQPSELPIDPTVLYALIIAVVAIVLAALFLVIRRKKKTSEAENPQS